MAANTALGNTFGMAIETSIKALKDAQKNISIRDQYVSALGNELMDLEGTRTQNPETGAGIDEDKSYLNFYTNRIFGAPYQLLDSVDRRFDKINKKLGSEYLRNIILNSPILHIKPGMPKYTGGDNSEGLLKKIKYMYMDTNMGDMSFTESLLGSLAQQTVFQKGSKLQRRMFGFRETYYDYMQHVNYMCRSVAVFLNLTTGEKFPDGTFTSTGYQQFSNMKWENYRMMSNSKAESPVEYLGHMVGSFADGPIELMKSIGKSAAELTASFFDQFRNPIDNVINNLNGGSIHSSNLIDALEETAANWSKKFKEEDLDGELVGEVIANKICSVEFMVNPVSFNETLHNETKESVIEQALDAAHEVGTELQFISNSRADVGMIDDLTSFLGNVTSTAAQFAAGLSNNVTGGFTTNLFSGALQSIKGQKMIYPKIYQSSTSSMDYEFSMTLTTPYGDPYNYFMNIVVPLIHLIALTAPRMVTSNTVTSPYLVQAYIPGQCTCQLGIIRDLIIKKNPTTKHVSVNGFPLTVEVSFTIEELYNAMSISPANDPSSFLFNETLNDYMSNLAGLIPSIDTYTAQRKEMFSNLNEYLSTEGILNDMVEPYIERAENFINPFSGR